MKNLILMVLVASLVFVVESQAATKKTTLNTFKCPAIISNAVQGAYQVIPAKFKCITESTPAKTAKLNAGPICNIGDDSALDDFSIMGSGAMPAESPVFWVTTTPRAFMYSYNPTSKSMKIDLKDGITKKTVISSLIVADGPVSGTTSYINKPGLYYFVVSGGDGDWEVDLLPTGSN